MLQDERVIFIKDWQFMDFSMQGVSHVSSDGFHLVMAKNYKK